MAKQGPYSWMSIDINFIYFIDYIDFMKAQKNLLRLLGVEVGSDTLGLRKNHHSVVCSQIFLINDPGHEAPHPKPTNRTNTEMYRILCLLLYLGAGNCVSSNQKNF